MISSLFIPHLLAIAASSTVLVVRPGGHFSQIQSAVHAASDGDTVLVKAGTYTGFSIGHKSINVVADTGQFVQVNGTISVSGLGTGQSAVLVGLFGNGALDGLTLSNNAGSVRMESCTLNGATAQCGAGRGAAIATSADVCLSRCHVVGGASQVETPDGDGLFATGSNVAVYDGECRSNTGQLICDASDCIGSFGGNGAEISSTFLFASLSTFKGGGGGLAPCGKIGCLFSCLGGLGGSGLVLESSSTAELLADTFVPGPGGAPETGGTLGPGQAIVGTGADESAGNSPTMHIDNPVRELSNVMVRVAGQNGDDVYLFMSRRTSFRFIPGYTGVLIPDQPGPPTFLGTVGPSQVFVTSITIPALGPGVDALNYYLQSAHHDTSGGWTLGTPVSLVVLSSAF
jgi:hypothetical protein